jgi:hypothetical protein
MRATVVEVRRPHWGRHHQLLRFRFRGRVYYSAPRTAPDGACTFRSCPGLDIRRFARKREITLPFEAAWRLVFATELEPLYERLRARTRKGEVGSRDEYLIGMRAAAD